MSEATENLGELLLQAIKAGLHDVHTCLPARIERYDESTQMADIAPLLKKKYKAENEPVDYPVVVNVPPAMVDLNPPVVLTRQAPSTYTYVVERGPGGCQCTLI